MTTKTGQRTRPEWSVRHARTRAASRTFAWTSGRVLGLRVRIARVRVVKVDAAARPATADPFGVVTVPTTAALTPDGAVAAVDNGFALTARLTERLAATAPSVRGQPNHSRAVVPPTRSGYVCAGSVDVGRRRALVPSPVDDPERA